MKWAILLFFIFIVSMSARAQSPWYYGAGKAVNLENAIQYKNGVQNITGTLDPSSSAVSAPAGSLYLNTNGNLYVKQDAGSSTNWFPLSTPIDLALKEDVANKATDFSVVNDTLYPSVEAVSEQLALKEDLANKATDFSTVNDTLYPTVEAVSEQLALKEDLSNKAIDFSTVNDTLYPTVEAVAEYVTASSGVAWGGITGTLSDQTDLQTALDAKVTGPASSVDGVFALFDSTTGKLIKEAIGTGFVKSTSGVYSTQASIDLTTDVGSSVLPLANGGTNKSFTASNGAIVYSDTDSMEFLSPGASGQILMAEGVSAPSWQFINDIKDRVFSVSTTQTLSTFGYYRVDTSGGTVTLTLMPVSGEQGKRLTFKKTTDSNTLVLDANSSETIDGNLTHTLYGKESVTLIVNGAGGWDIL